MMSEFDIEWVESIMSRYQKKPYKKRSFDPYREIDIKKEFEDAMNMSEGSESIDDLFYDEAETAVFNDEPEIVQQLRREELNGTLGTDNDDVQVKQEQYAHNSSMLTMTPVESFEQRPAISYEETYEIAKKSLENLSSKNNNAIHFE